MNKKIITTGAAFGATAIILGAFGAHALKEVLTTEALATFETGVKYQMYHALFLLFIGMMGFISEKAKQTIFYLIITGVLLFSGSIYLLATKSLSGIDFKIIGIATPVGGFLLILGWICLFVNILKQKS
ncbi:MAG: DUF423 domain-containing protein [Flavobacterium sp.]|nr:DUF423 domain-containing protein [Flavobacterium sp.]